MSIKGSWNFRGSLFPEAYATAHNTQRNGSNVSGWMAVYSNEAYAKLNGSLPIANIPLQTNASSTVDNDTALENYALTTGIFSGFTAVVDSTTTATTTSNSSSTSTDSTATTSA
ncbi:hypothetical protein O1V64_00105 (plasmid) [Rouxiella badensis]|uniref:hypothetical protein n=1 Tax=Rouxiella badensis TaxID=1646377 RepID=UPI00111C7435|nr:hypothetical protein [Rouxiella badensis]WAT03219.1 hypothetical protein O1V64_00615 [Rouxiella badensis]WAT03230.1 hypothetical protein O1V64_00670 [Rouxiella badensis]WAT03250.1 hypothetical protein O1V64_00055 [Rouxiella badensis]WAT03260.1 hypothetical protein O1V64_00105 [Rouxiella badensis]